MGRTLALDELLAQLRLDGGPDVLGDEHRALAQVQPGAPVRHERAVQWCVQGHACDASVLASRRQAGHLMYMDMDMGGCVRALLDKQAIYRRTLCVHESAAGAASLDQAV